MAKRKSVNYPGYSHQNPIPNASRIGNIVMSSIMNGTEPGTRNVPPDLGAQVTAVDPVMTQGGGGVSTGPADLEGGTARGAAEADGTTRFRRRKCNCVAQIGRTPGFRAAALSRASSSPRSCGG